MAIVICPDCGSVTPEGVVEINGNVITYVCHDGICDCRFDVEATCPADLRDARLDLFYQKVGIGILVLFGLALYVGLPATVITLLVKWLF